MLEAIHGRFSEVISGEISEGITRGSAGAILGEISKGFHENKNMEKTLKELLN